MNSHNIALGSFARSSACTYELVGKFMRYRQTESANAIYRSVIVPQNGDAAALRRKTEVGWSFDLHPLMLF